MLESWDDFTRLGQRGLQLNSSREVGGGWDNLARSLDLQGWLVGMSWRGCLEARGNRKGVLDSRQHAVPSCKILEN